MKQLNIAVFCLLFQWKSNNNFDLITSWHHKLSSGSYLINDIALWWSCSIGSFLLHKFLDSWLISFLHTHCSWVKTVILQKTDNHLLLVILQWKLDYTRSLHTRNCLLWAWRHDSDFLLLLTVHNELFKTMQIIQNLLNMSNYSHPKLLAIYCFLWFIRWGILSKWRIHVSNM